MKIELKKINEKDTQNIIRWRNNPKVLMNFIDQNLLTEEIHKNWLLNHVYSGQAVQYIITLNDGETRTDVGSVFLKDINYLYKSAEFGIFIGENFATGKGVGKEAVSQILQVAFNDLKLLKVLLKVKKSNVIAINLYEKIGFKTFDENLDLYFMKIEV